MQNTGAPKCSSRHLVDLELLPVLEALPLFDLSMETLPAMRSARAAIGAGDQAFPALQFERRKVQGPDGHTVSINLFRPEGADGLHPAILHIHGGGAGRHIKTTRVDLVAKTLYSADIAQNMMNKHQINY